MQKFFDSVVRKNVNDDSLVAVPFAGITVNVHGGGLASIYDINGNPASNPFQADAVGYFEFYAADGRYDVVLSGPDAFSRTVQNVILDDPAQPSAIDPASGIKFTPTGGLSSTDVQAALEELDSEKQGSLGYTAENVAHKDASGGYAGLTLFKLNLRNALNTVTSWFTTAATVARTWTLPDKDGTVAMTSDITGTNSGTNTGDETGARIAVLDHAAASKATLVDADELSGTDSASSYSLMRVTFSNLKASIKTYTDTLYQTLSNLATSTSLGTSNTLYPSQNAVKFYVDAGDAATLASANAYSDAVAQGLSIKTSVRLATAAALPSNVYANGSSGVGATITGVSTGVLTVDGQTVALNDRILVKNETSQLENGIYKCTTAGAVGVLFVLTRVTDNDQTGEFVGAFTFVEDGTANASAGFVCANTTAPTVGTTAITWTQFSGAGEITAGTGLSKSGNTLSVDQAFSPTWSGTHTFAQTGLKVKGASANALVVKPNETLSTDRTLNVKVNDADRTVDLSGNLTVPSAATVSGTNTGDETTTTIGALINGATSKTTPVDADYLGLMDSAASNILKKLSWANLKATLKTYFDTLYASSGSGVSVAVPVRQTVLTGPTSAGVPNFLAAGTGLAVNLANNSASVPVVVTFANGFSAVGSADFASLLTSTASAIVTLPASNLSFITATYSSSSAVTWGSTLWEPQYGYVYDRTKFVLMHFNGTNASTSMIDDNGNTFTASGNAQLDTSQSKFGSASLKLDGTGDYISSSVFTDFGSESWTLECWVRWNTLPTSGQAMSIFTNVINGNSYGLLLQVDNSGGTYRTVVYLSSNGSSWDIASNNTATITPVTGTWYHIAITWDKVTGKYYVYFNGTKTNDITSSLVLLSGASGGLTTGLTVGHGYGGFVDFNGWMDEFRYSKGVCQYPAGTAFTPSASAFDITAAGQSGEWFDLNAMQMKSISAASSAAATDPTFTALNKVYVGESTTTSSGHAAGNPISYALRGVFESPVSANANVSGITAYLHNLGVKPRQSSLRLRCLIASNAWQVGDEIDLSPNYSAAQIGLGSLRNQATQNTGSTALAIPDKTTGGTFSNITTANWGIIYNAYRGW